MVTFRGDTWTLFKKIGSVQRATAPKPRNRTFPRNLIIAPKNEKLRFWRYFPRKSSAAHCTLPTFQFLWVTSHQAGQNEEQATTKSQVRKMKEKTCYDNKVSRDALTPAFLRELNEVTPDYSDETAAAGSSMLGIVRRLPRTSLLLRIILLGVAVLIVAAVILPLALLISGNRAGLYSAAAAGGVCLLSAWLALCASEPLRRPQSVLALVVVGMMIRMGIPLAAALTVFFRGGPLADAGFLYYVVLFYPVTLIAETYLSTPGCEPNKKDVSPARDLVG